MPRKALQADLQRSIEKTEITRISNVRRGDDDGEFKFLLQCGLPGQVFDVEARISDVSDYPSSHHCCFIAPDDAPQDVGKALESLLDKSSGKSVEQLLQLASNATRRLSMSKDSSDSEPESENDLYDGHSSNEEEEDEDEEEVDEDIFFPDDGMELRVTHSTATSTKNPSQFHFRQRVRSDLRRLKKAGFKVSYHGPFEEGMKCYLSISCRVCKLGISNEAMEAWRLEPNEYLILLLQYPNGYQPLESLLALDIDSARRNVGIRTGVHRTYKPTARETAEAFSQGSASTVGREKSYEATRVNDDGNNSFRGSFISKPLDEMLNNRLIKLTQLRNSGLSWDGAEGYLQHCYKNNISSSDAVPDKFFNTFDCPAISPQLSAADQFTDAKYVPQSLSFPLVAMQFFLRHFVRCTEYCLVCFTRLPDALEAIKPYVCDDPLCLYQYMSLGFGPGIEHEIITQPYVVDVLISFCYVSAVSGNLTGFPTGLSLLVPNPSAISLDPNQPPNAQNQASGTKCRVDLNESEILLDCPPPCPLQYGDWIILYDDKAVFEKFQCRVLQTNFFPRIKVSRLTSVLASAHDNKHYPLPSTTGSSLAHQPTSSSLNVWPVLSTKSGFQPAFYYKYDTNFDELQEQEKRGQLVFLMRTMPKVLEMRQYLVKHPNQSLGTWHDRMNPATISLLRWIVASCRACIMQVGTFDGKTSASKSRPVERATQMSSQASSFKSKEAERLTQLPAQASSYKSKQMERVTDMPAYIQFKFAMGAPDKERRFLSAVNEMARRKPKEYPTIFAWHGSSTNNWHNIIREGLHFNYTANGRSFGHGVYHSPYATTSLGYSRSTGVYWPNSALKLTSVLALNEIVNAPEEFVSRTPHLVVAQLDWIQTRFLFVQSGHDQALSNPPGSDTKPQRPYPQDPALTPTGQTGAKIVIPWSSISRAKGLDSTSIPQTTHQMQAATVSDKMNHSFSISSSKARKKRKLSDEVVSTDHAGSEDEDGASVLTLEEDLELLRDEAYQSDNDDEKSTEKAPSAAVVVARKSETDFVPGQLDSSSIVLLAPPSWATTSATKRLQMDFKSMIKTQKSEPLHELGWYIDPELVSNMYQWIVELHSFDPELPLAQDMKAQGIKSLVMEMRFGKDYPMTPPFVRMVKPRFLPFNQGGGGHIMAGGALCMELLTNTGWSAVSSIDSVLLQVRFAITSLKRPARLAKGTAQSYGIHEAMDGYIRACNIHGWEIPPDFRKMAFEGLHHEATPSTTPR